MPFLGSVRRCLAVFCLLLALLANHGSGEAGKPRCRLERIDLSSFEKTGQVKAIGGLIEIEGQVASGHPARDFRLQINGKTAARGDKLDPFERSGQELYMALLVEISALYAPSIEKIRDAIKEFLDALPQRAKVKLILFGYDIEQQPTFMPAPAVGGLLDDMNPDDQGDVQLINAINAGLAALNKVQPAKDKSGNPLPPPRKVMVVLSDGLNQLMDRKSFRRVGDLLKHSNVPLFPVAFSPRDDRGPLLNLGELAKRSAGTFRWAQKDDNLKEQFANLADELRQGPVISFAAKKFDLDDLVPASFTLICGEQKSAPFILAGMEKPARGGWWKWLLGILGTLVLLWLAAQAALLVLKRRGGIATAPAGPGPAPQSAAAAGGPGPAVAAAYQPVALAPGGRVYGATLIGIGAGQLGGKRLKLGAELMLGKAVSGDLGLVISDDPSVGAVHCAIRRDGAGFVLFEMNAPSGSFINDQRVAGPTRLRDGDLLRLGESTQFRFRLDD